MLEESVIDIIIRLSCFHGLGYTKLISITCTNGWSSFSMQPTIRHGKAISLLIFIMKFSPDNNHFRFLLNRDRGEFEI